MLSSIPDLAAQRAQLDPGACAFRELGSNRRMTYLQLEQRIRKVAGLLQNCGVGESDRVAILCRNRIEFFEVLFACAKLGAILLPLNWRMPANELRPLIENAAPIAMLYGAEDRTVVAAIARSDLLLLDLDDDGADGFRTSVEDAPGIAGRPYWPSEQCWYLLYTSGTTGHPKGVIQTYGMALANYVNIRQAMAIGSNDVTLNFLPLFHTAGINLVTLPTLLEGGEVLITPGFDPDVVVDLIANNELDTFFAVPAVYQQLSYHPEFGALDLHTVRSWGCGGAPMPSELTERYLSRGAQICNGMGMTETGPTVFLMDPKNVANKIGSVGKPQLLASVRVVDAHGKDVQQGQSGEFWFSGPGVTPGYWRNETGTKQAFSDDGWLKSGDEGRCDADGYYYVVDRIKDMFISGGENVYPAEIERLLVEHPDILEVAVTAVPDDKWGEVGHGFVLTKPGHTMPTDAELRAFCNERIAKYKIPQRFISVADFPRTAAGKIQKYLLKATP